MSNLHLCFVVGNPWGCVTCMDARVGECLLARSYKTVMQPVLGAALVQPCPFRASENVGLPQLLVFATKNMSNNF